MNNPREIKFRAWNGKNKEFVYEVLRCGEDINSVLNSKTSGLIFQQFTGLKDKNGKEIYEGDILHPVGEKDKSYNIVVDIDLPKIGGSDLTHWIVWPEDNEIVGNIYENPDLLDS